MNALYANTGGSDNTAIGLQSLFANTTGYYNTAVGLNAIYSNTYGEGNTGVGASALFGNSTGYYNTAIGYNALYSNTNGNYNTASGSDALQFNTTGYNNCADGGYTLYSNTTGFNNTALGMEPLYSNTNGFNNTATGNVALFSNTSGHSNIAYGVRALYFNSTGVFNIAVGDSALYSNTTAYYNSAFGHYALFHNGDGFENTAIGSMSMFSNTIGEVNTATGFESLYNNTSGSENTAYGYHALYSNTDGDYNTAEGFGAMEDVSGTYMTAIGFGAEPVAGGLSNSTSIGAYSFNTGNDQVRLGDGYVVSIGGYVGWSNLSDGRVKKNIRNNVPGLAFINKLQPVTYNIDLDAADKITQRPVVKDKEGKALPLTASQIASRKAKEQIVYTGFIAQDVEKAAKSLSYDFSGVDPAQNDKDLYGLRYGDFVVPLVKAVQELSVQNDSLKSQAAAQEVINKNLQQQIDQLKNISGGISGMVKIGIDEESSLLGQNIPNPFNHTTLIPFRIPGDCHDASIAISETATGKIVKLVPVSCTQTQLSLDAGTLSAGNYSYSLYVDGRLVETKQMVLTK